MRTLEPEEILDLDTYDAVRPAYRERILAHKRERRVGVGDRVTLTFEDRETLRYQIQEMARIERIREPTKVQHEIDVYNALVPGEHELSATLFIEIPDLKLVRSELDRLIGIDEHVGLVLGEDDDSEWVRARFDQEQMEEDRISAVHYIRFTLTPEQQRRFESDERVRVAIDHPAYTCEAEVSPPLRASLLRDLAGATPELLEPDAVERARPPEPSLVYEDELVRVLRPARPLAREHWWIEARDAQVTLSSADAQLVGALAVRARQVATEVIERSGRRCRIAVEDGPGVAGPLRWHVVSVDD